MADEYVEKLEARLASLEQTLARVRDNTETVRKAIAVYLWRQVQATQESFYAELIKNPRYHEPKRLQQFERQIFSQNGEDGIIEEIFRRIGPASRRFLEIGVEDGRETNTTWLLQQGWSGVWIDADANAIRRAATEFARPISEKRLAIAVAMVTAENIVSVLQKLPVAQDLDLMSLDIDRNTFYLWQALGHLKPRVIVVEYNAINPPDQDWRVEYVPNRVWNGSSYFGASLKAYEKLGTQLGYCLVGCDTSGGNAFFVRKDLVQDLFARPFTSENHYEPPRYFLARAVGHPRGFDDNASEPNPQK